MLDDAVPDSKDNSTKISKGSETILVVDDEKPILKLLVRFLEKEGFQLKPFFRSAEALEFFQKNPKLFQIAILDLTMPGMSGTELAREILKVRAEIPMIFFTGNGWPEEEIAEFPDAVLIKKPVELAVLKKAVREALGLNGDGAAGEGEAS